MVEIDFMPRPLISRNKQTRSSEMVDSPNKIEAFRDNMTFMAKSGDFKNSKDSEKSPERMSLDNIDLPGEMSVDEVARLFKKGMSEERLWQMQLAKYRTMREKQYSSRVRSLSS